MGCRLKNAREALGLGTGLAAPSVKIPDGEHAARGTSQPDMHKVCGCLGRAGGETVSGYFGKIVQRVVR